MDIQEFAVVIETKNKQLQEFIRSQAVKDIVGTEAVAHFKASFENEGFTDERRRKFRELNTNPNYIDVAFNPENGALKATHIGHNFDRKKGWYEKKVQEVGYKAGHEVILENEKFGNIGERFTEGTWNGKKFEIAAAETGTAKNIRKKLKHCASKRETKVAVIYYPDASKYSEIDFVRGLLLYEGLKDDPRQYLEFESIYVIIDSELVIIK